MERERSLHHRALLALLLCALIIATLLEIVLMIPFIKEGGFTYRNVPIPWTVTLFLGVFALAAWIVFMGLARKREWSRKAVMAAAAVVLCWVMKSMTELINAGQSLMARDHVKFLKIQFSGDAVRWIFEGLAAFIIVWSVTVLYLALAYPEASRGDLDPSSEPDTAK